MSPEEMREIAVELFKKRMHCSQAVAAAGLAFEGLDEPGLIKAMGAFGGGIASQGETCGCLTGAIAAVSRLYSRGDPSAKESPDMWRVSYRVLKRFKELTEPLGGMDCRAIARVDWRDKEAVKDFYKNPDSRRHACIQLVGDTAHALGEILAQRPQWDGGE